MTVVEAVLATCATQPFFLPIIVGQDSHQQELVGGVMGVANPCQELIAEAIAKFRGSPKVSVLLSIGSGHLGTLTVPGNTREEDWTIILQSMIANSEKTAQDMEEKMGGKSFYFRFSVDQGLQRHYGIAGDDPVWVNAQTEAYLSHEVIEEALDNCVDGICQRPDIVGLKELRGSGAMKASQVIEFQSQLLNEKGTSTLPSA